MEWSTCTSHVGHVYYFRNLPVHCRIKSIWYSWSRARVMLEPNIAGVCQRSQPSFPFGSIACTSQQWPHSRESSFGRRRGRKPTPSIGVGECNQQETSSFYLQTTSFPSHFYKQQVMRYIYLWDAPAVQGNEASLLIRSISTARSAAKPAVTDRNTTVESSMST